MVFSVAREPDMHFQSPPARGARSACSNRRSPPWHRNPGRAPTIRHNERCGYQIGAAVITLSVVSLALRAGFLAGPETYETEIGQVVEYSIDSATVFHTSCWSDAPKSLIYCREGIEPPDTRIFRRKKGFAGPY